MIQIKDLSLSFNDRCIFDAISCIVQQDQRIGLVGRNGSGKSTLLKIIAGYLSADEGTISIEKNKKIAYMPQEVTMTSQKSVIEEALSVFDHYLSLAKEKANLEEYLASGLDHDGSSLDRYLALQEQLEDFDYSAVLARTHKIMDGLGFTATMHEQPVAQLSVGWKMRLVLCKLLLQDADFYLFDEPTNHLDIVTQEWFFDFLKQSSFGFLLVTHDRYFLERACDYILELERSNATMYRGNFSSYLVQKEEQKQSKESAYNRQQREIERKQATIERFRASASKAKMAKSMEKQLDKMERIEIEPPLATIRLNFPTPVRPGTTVLKASNIKQSFEGRTIFKDVHCELQRGEKVAIVAPNGTGKTTFFNSITGKYVVETGSVSFGHNVQYAVFEQDQLESLTPSNTIIEEILNACTDIQQGVIRSFLGSFLFTGDDIYKKISVLSGGERNRVAMVKVLLQKANFLLLDEPTNHLDLYAKDVLLQALQQYEGTMLIVCHDHDFLNKLATRIIELTPTGMHSYAGNYESYLAHKKYTNQQNAPTPSRAKEQAPAQAQPAAVKEAASVQKEVASLEGKIAHLEKDIEAINQRFFSYTYGTHEYDENARQLKAKQDELKTFLKRWEELQVQAEAVMAKA